MYDSQRIEEPIQERLTIDERYEVLKGMKPLDLIEYLTDELYLEVKNDIIDKIVSYNLDL